MVRVFFIKTPKPFAKNLLKEIERRNIAREIKSEYYDNNKPPTKRKIISPTATRDIKNLLDLLKDVRPDLFEGDITYA